MPKRNNRNNRCLKEIIENNRNNRCLKEIMEKPELEILSRQ